MRLKIALLLLLLPLVAITTPACRSSSTAPSGQETEATVTLEQETYAANAAITIEYAGLPGNDQDWITLVKASDPDDTYGEWFYTGGAKAGTYTFAGLEPGAYEVRVYYNWPDGGFDVQQRLPVVVK